MPKPKEAIELHIPNCNNCIQSAIHQIKVGNIDRALSCLEAAKKSLAAAKEDILGIPKPSL